MKKLISLLIMLLTLSPLAIACGDTRVTAPAVEAPPPPVEISVAVVGDVMMHSPQFKAAYSSSTKSYGFSDCFSDIAPVIQEADIAIANIETTFCGAAKGYSGYPTFNSPEQLLPALKDAGFDVLTTANNHCMDRGSAGIVSTIDYIRKAGFEQTGTFATTAGAIKPLITEAQGIKIGIVAATYSLNGFTLPAEKKFMANLIDSKLLAQQIAAAREAGADIVAVSLHFGNEYQRQPSDYQKQVADAAIRAGADIVLGSHPHVLQPIEMRTLPATATHTTQSAIVVWSMGNFISNQRDRYKDSGMIFTFDIRKVNPDAKAEIINPAYLPTYVYKGPLNGKATVYQILDVGKYINNNGAFSMPGGNATSKRLQEVWLETTQLIGESPAVLRYQTP